MSDARANIVITADPRGAQQGLQRVKGSLADLEGQSKRIMAEFKNLAKGTKEFADKAKELKDVNRKIRDIKDAVGGLQEKAKASTLATQALGASLGFLGATSVTNVLSKLIGLGRESFQLALGLQAVEGQARAVFGTAFPQMQQRAEELAQTLRRSDSDLLQYMAGFGDFLDQLGAGPQATQRMSASLAELTVQFGKLRPNIPDSQVFEALQAGLAGNYRSLRQLGILITDETLQAYTDLQGGIRNKVKDMDAEQRATLLTMYLEDLAAKKKEELAKATGGAGDAVKTAGAAWVDLREELGKGISPVVADALRQITEMLEAARSGMAAMGRAWAGLKGLFGGGSSPPPANATTGHGMTVLGGSLVPKRDGWTGTVGHFGRDRPAADKQAAIDVLNRNPNVSGGGGGGNTTEQLLREREAAEGRILSALGEQARASLEMTRTRRDDLKLRERLGVLTKDEARELDRINRRMEFKKDLLDEATKAWEQQAEAVKKAVDRVNDLVRKVADARNDLTATLSDINREAAKSRVDTAADLIREMKDLDTKIAQGRGNTQDELDRRRQIEAALSTQDAATLAEGKAASGLNEFELIERERQAKRREAEEKANARIEELQLELDVERQKLAAVEAAEAQKKQAVVTALNDRLLAVQTAFEQERQATKAHVDALVAEYDRLNARKKQATGAKPGPAADIPALAEGGIVTRPTLALIGERGPEAVVPLNKGPVGGITIGKIEVHNEADEDRLVRKLTRLIQLQSLHAA